MTRRRSPIFAVAVAQYHVARAEYSTLLESAYAKAEEALSGALLNARGRRAQIDPFSLFMGTESRANAYASAELVEYWTRHPRVTWTAFERQFIEKEGEAA